MRKYSIIVTLFLLFTGVHLCHAFVVDKNDKNMLKLSADETFNYELLRVLATSRAYGADVGEVLTAAERIIPGDFESWYNAFITLADHINNNLPNTKHPVSLRNALFRAASYYRAADFFLHGNPADPRINETWAKQRNCFDKAISLLGIPAYRVEIKASGFTVPAIVYRPDNTNKPRPTLLLCNGYDGSQEEMLHVIGFAALERGFNVVTFEGPGQPTVVREQHLGFIAEWEKVVTPVVDYCNSLGFVDNGNVVLLGFSFGGYLAPRAAAFEHRLAAVVCADGLFDIYDAFSQSFPPALRQLHQEKNSVLFDQIVSEAMKDSDNIKLRWGAEQGCWSFCTTSPYEFLEKTRSMTMKNIAANIQCPVLVCEAEADHFFAGQPQILAGAIGAKATYMQFTSADSAQEHCHAGASDFFTAKVMDWIENTIN